MVSAVLGRVGLIHTADDDQPGECGEGGDCVDRNFDRDEVGEDTGEQCADGKAGVAPQPVDAD